MKQIKHLGSFFVGASLSTAFVLQMNDIVYTQMRKHIIHPFMNIKEKQSGEINIQDIKEVGQGVASFASQFKPHELIHEGARSLLTDDSEIQSPTENYFAYINKRKLLEADNTREQSVLDNLQIDKIINKELIKPIKQQSQQIESEQDIFELARKRGQRVGDLQELNIIKNDKQEQTNSERQKFLKKDYEKLKSMDLKSIIEVGTQKRVRRRFQEEDDQINKDIVKVEKKKQLKLSKQENRERQDQIQRMLQNPQGLDYEKVMQLYEDQRLEAAELSKKDKRRLRRLKQKAQEQNENKKEQVKIGSVSEGFEETNLDEIIK